MRVLITGANRGLGYEFARQYRDRGYEVIATARDPEGAGALRELDVRVEALDVGTDASVTGLAQRLQNVTIDILINNAGVKGQAVASFLNLDNAGVERTLNVNSIGPLRVLQALYPNLEPGEGKKIVQISSGLGSIGRNNGGSYDYRMSKAALNMFNRTLALELGPAGYICVVLRPGWVRTDMGGPDANLSPQESVGGMIEVIENLGPDDNGRFIGYDGMEIPW
jgi:NAD(P)-dependent dehydrogenase (short-subunit alcohol dehydrogenase family)